MIKFSMIFKSFLCAQSNSVKIEQKKNVQIEKKHSGFFEDTLVFLWFLKWAGILALINIFIMTIFLIIDFKFPFVEYIYFNSSKHILTEFFAKEKASTSRRIFVSFLLLAQLYLKYLIVFLLFFSVVSFIKYRTKKTKTFCARRFFRNIKIEIIVGIIAEILLIPLFFVTIVFDKGNHFQNENMKKFCEFFYKFCSSHDNWFAFLIMFISALSSAFVIIRGTIFIIKNN
jgi:hypothetical protein